MSIAFKSTILESSSEMEENEGNIFGQHMKSLLLVLHLYHKKFKYNEQNVAFHSAREVLLRK